MGSESIALWSVAAYMCVCLLIGLVAFRSTRSTGDFFVAGRRLGIVTCGLSIAASTLSGFAFVGGPGLIYRMGTSSIWILITAPVAHTLVFVLLARRLRGVAGIRDCLSLPDVVLARFGSRVLSGTVAAVSLLGVVGYLATQILAMAVVLKGLLSGVDMFSGWDLGVCVGISTGVLVGYCALGGALASVWTDVLQGVVMVCASVCVFFLAKDAVADGFTGMSRILLSDDVESIGPWGTLGVVGCLSWYLLFSIGVLGQPHIIGKLMMTRNPGAAPRMLPLVIGVGVLGALLWLSVGLVMRAMVISGAQGALPGPDDASVTFIQEFAHPVLGGLVFAALFAAIMSTADAFLNIGAAALVHDLPKAVWGRVPRRELAWGRIVTLVLGLLAAWLALRGFQLVGMLGTASWGIFAAALVPVVAIGLNWRRATTAGALAAVAVGTVVNFCPIILDFRLPAGFSPGALALLASVSCFWWVSCLTPAESLPEDLSEALDLPGGDDSAEA